MSDALTTVLVRRTCREARIESLQYLETWCAGELAARVPVVATAEIADGTLTAVVGCDDPECSCAAPGVAAEVGEVGSPRTLTLPVPGLAHVRTPVLADWPDGERCIAVEVTGGVHNGMVFSLHCGFDARLSVGPHTRGAPAAAAVRAPSGLITRVLLGVLDPGELLVGGEVEASLATMTVAAMGFETAARTWAPETWALALLERVEECGFRVAA